MNYYKISVTEFETLMDEYDAERVTVPGTHEYVYEIPTEAAGLVVRIFSTLTRQDDGARDAGRDAIRTLAWSRTADAAVAQATRTHRIDSWADNLAPKITDMIARIEAGEFDDRTPDATLAGLVPRDPDETAVVVSDLIDTRYGRKAALDSPYEAKEAIKALSWDDTHRSWDADRSAWTVDAAALPLVAEELAGTDYPLRAPAVETVDDDAFDVGRLDVTPEVGDEVTITYEKKNGNGEAEKSGVVTYVDLDESTIKFTREDGQGMRVTNDGLYTFGSSYPYVGKPVAITVSVIA